MKTNAELLTLNNGIIENFNRRQKKLLICHQKALPKYLGEPTLQTILGSEEGGGIHFI